VRNVKNNLQIQIRVPAGKPSKPNQTSLPL